jgi:hypothetical protein
MAQGEVLELAFEDQLHAAFPGNKIKKPVAADVRRL